jgi:hypothetical protein
MTKYNEEKEEQELQQVTNYIGTCQHPKKIKGPPKNNY